MKTFRSLTLKLGVVFIAAAALMLVTHAGAGSAQAAGNHAVSSAQHASYSVGQGKSGSLIVAAQSTPGAGSTPAATTGSGSGSGSTGSASGNGSTGSSSGTTSTSTNVSFFFGLPWWAVLLIVLVVILLIVAIIAAASNRGGGGTTTVIR